MTTAPLPSKKSVIAVYIARLTRLARVICPKELSIIIERLFRTASALKSNAIARLGNTFERQQFIMRNLRPQDEIEGVGDEELE